MPLMGFDELPSSPVIREDTTEKKKPKTTIATADSTPIHTPGTARSCGRNDMNSTSTSEPATTTDSGRSRSVRGLRSSPPCDRSWRSRNEERNESRIVGSAFSRLMMPPAATAPAPM